MAANVTDPAAAQAALEAEIAVLLTANYDYRLTREFWLLSFAILLYDYLLTFDEEVEYLARGRFSFMKGVFLLNRYWPIGKAIFDNIVLALPHPSEPVCYFWANFVAYSAFLMHFTIGTILILRIHVMYGCNKKLLVLLCSLFALQLISETIVIGFTISQVYIEPLPPLPNFTGCIPISTKSWQWMYWLPMLGFESLLFGMAVVKSVKVYKDSKQTHTGKAPNLLVILIRDSVMYFGGVFAVLLTNIIAWAIAPPGLFSTFVYLAYAAHSILGCRMMFNIQDAAGQRVYTDDIATDKSGHRFYSRRRSTLLPPATESFPMKPVSRADPRPVRIEVETFSYAHAA